MCKASTHITDVFSLNNDTSSRPQIAIGPVQGIKLGTLGPLTPNEKTFKAKANTRHAKENRRGRDIQIKSRGDYPFTGP